MYRYVEFECSKEARERKKKGKSKLEKSMGRHASMGLCFFFLFPSPSNSPSFFLSLALFLPHPNRWNPDREDKPSYQSYKVDINRYVERKGKGREGER